MPKSRCAFCAKLFDNPENLSIHLHTEHPSPSEEDIDGVAKRSIFEYLNSDGADHGLRERARQANAYRATIARREATQSAREQMTVILARSLSNSPEEFVMYMKIAAPNTPMLKAAPPSFNKPKPDDTT